MGYLRPRHHMSCVALSLARLRATVDRRDYCVASDAWKSDFKTQLEKYPELTAQSSVHGGAAPRKCGACFKANHAVCSLVYLRGTPYNPVNFEPVPDTPHRKTKDAKPGPTFVLGKQCSRRVSVYHQLFHFAQSLHQACTRKVRQLQDRGIDTEAGIVEALMDDLKWIRRQEGLMNELLAEADRFRRG